MKYLRFEAYVAYLSQLQYIYVYYIILCYITIASVLRVNLIKADAQPLQNILPKY